MYTVCKYSVYHKISIEKKYIIILNYDLICRFMLFSRRKNQKVSIYYLCVLRIVRFNKKKLWIINYKLF